MLSFDVIFICCRSLAENSPKIPCGLKLRPQHVAVFGGVGPFFASSVIRVRTQSRSCASSSDFSRRAVSTLPRAFIYALCKMANVGVGGAPRKRMTSHSFRQSVAFWPMCSNGGEPRLRRPKRNWCNKVITSISLNSRTKRIKHPSVLHCSCSSL